MEIVPIGGLVALEPREHVAAFAPCGGVLRVERDHAVGDGELPVEIAPPVVYPLQVAKDPHRDLPARSRRDRPRQGPPRLLHGAGDRRQPRHQLDGRDPGAPVERVDEDPPGSGRCDEEMRRERDGHQRQPEPPADLQIDDRERDRYAGPALDHLVQVAVARVEVIVPVPPEALDLEELPVEHREALRQGHPEIRGIGDRLRRRVEPCEVHARVETGIRIHREGECDPRDVERLVRLGYEGLEIRRQRLRHVALEPVAPQNHWNIVIDFQPPGLPIGVPVRNVPGKGARPNGESSGRTPPPVRHPARQKGAGPLQSRTGMWRSRLFARARAAKPLPDQAIVFGRRPGIAGTCA